MASALFVALSRSLLFVPGHIASTGYASCRLARFVFSSPDGVPKSPSLIDYASFLWLPVVQHTIFRTSLTLALLYTTDSLALWLTATLSMPTLCVLVMAILFVREWRSLAKLPFYNKRGGVMTEVRVIGASTQS
mmetsp:Transcript_40448/g.115288  ORF Transcript_40448/g.115288 Transcript_40448/m.115288 type:complete len:134 (-) Transcript_40448:521-922(-)